jgi:hypothetical protein
MRSWVESSVWKEALKYERASFFDRLWSSSVQYDVSWAIVLLALQVSCSTLGFDIVDV